MNEDSYLVVLGVIVVILFIALIFLTYKVFELQHKVARGNKQKRYEENLEQTGKEKKHEPQEPKIVAEQQKSITRNVNLTEGVSDINGSMKRYSMKYNLDSATLASMDGFSIASSHADSEQEAANLTARYRENALTDIGDAHIIPLEYRGEPILIIIRTTQKITKEGSDMMIRDGRAVLSHWL